MIRPYLQATRAPRYSLLFALPLLITYQVLAALAPAGPGGVGIRNGADVALESVFVWLAGAWGPRLFLLCLIVAGAWLIATDVRRNHASIRPALLAGMLGEAFCLALVFGIVVGGLTSALLGGPPPGMAIGTGFTLQHISRATLFMISLGAGIYEELLFRVLLVGLLAWAANKVLGWRPKRAIRRERKSTRLNSSHTVISYAVFYFKNNKMLGNPPGAVALYVSHDTAFVTL